ncbi:HAD family hydrolase [Paenibacillus sp. GSMTC-2017]|uniref:HAD family hydrolase n=1 Tax=Paenibacillus sp. GSMTC-2017 TaxID=2794350 RepID=UPI0018D84118|nr:HAD family hydrolase [Paenibacillus sp. GSMTC-2017]MBH5317646.1 HAD family hydrolase [Paenibacillus sp. GSMTC-2017]
MQPKALFLDFYGTVVHEDDDILPPIYEQIRAASLKECTLAEIGHYWWNSFSNMFGNSYGQSFKLQRTLGVESLRETILHFNSSIVAEEIIQKQFEHWQKPAIFADSIDFLQSCTIPIYILSNIDSDDVMAALEHHNIQVNGVLTSEDVRSYKPRPEIFREALSKYRLATADVLHVGDSLISDIKGAQALGISAAWINRNNKQLPEHIQPDYILKDLSELKQMLSDI